MSKIDYEFKSVVLNVHQDIIKLQKQFSRENYLVERIENYDKTKYKYLSEILSHFANEDEYMWKVYKECEKINHASYKRNKRLKDRIEQMLLDGNCYFLTLTFSDDTLNRTSDKWRRKSVTYILKEISPEYVANIDYGKKNGREHYHAVIRCDSVPDLSAWKRFGFFNVKLVRSEDDFEKLGKYVGKLTNHAIKNTTRGTRIIYSK